tara:strand:- start:411 stop:1190 length:780 start_codon:yes stop_codon:yes gene_type:complete
MLKQRCYKVECNGNDFVLIIKDDLVEPINTNIIKKLCDRKNGIGADGLLLVDLNINNYDFQMDYYNNDGSWETMCANGAMCIIQVLQQRQYHFNTNKFLAGDGEHKIKISNKRISIQMKPPSFKTKDINIAGCIGAHIDSGAKHFVTISKVKDIDSLYKLAQSIRYDDYFSPLGLNVNFLDIISKNKINVITYEKGIEKIMKSCGSGSVAAAFYAAQKHDIQNPLTIINSGGEMQLIFNDDWSDLWLMSNPTIEFAVNY